MRPAGAVIVLRDLQAFTAQAVETVVRVESQLPKRSGVPDSLTQAVFLAQGAEEICAGARPDTSLKNNRLISVE